LENPIEHPSAIPLLFTPFRRNKMAKAALEGAIWDLYCKQRKISLSEALGGVYKEIAVGVAIGIKPTIEILLKEVEERLEEGYRRIKVKIKPGWDVEVLRAIRNRFPKISLMADANSAYRLEDLPILKKMDDLDLLMIEQPLAFDDIVEHKELQRNLKTPICLDESITSYEDARNAISIGSCKVINIKIGRVGGITEAKRIHDLCLEKGIPVWCGGMFESGIGRSHNIAISSLSNFSIPGDISDSSRWYRDIVNPPIEIKNGMIEVPTSFGIGVEIDYGVLDQVTIQKMVFHK
jgi:o-succinylbenzoate synthase